MSTYCLRLPLNTFNQAIVFCSKTIFFVLLGLGNLLRVISLPGFLDNLLITEPFLYGSCLLSLLVTRPPLKVVLFLLIFSFVVASSFSFGALLHGVNIKAFVYALRVCCLVWCGVQLGHLLFAFFVGDLILFLEFLLRAYLCCLSISILIYVCFPASSHFWEFLAHYGVDFHGDPHSGRFVSVYFDPNFYGAIGCIPFSIALLLFRHTRQPKYLRYCCLFAVSILLALSRSGIVTYLLMMLYFYRHKLKNFKVWVVNKYILWIIACVLGLFCYACTVGQEHFYFFFYRFTHMAEDLSALSRWMSFQLGVDLLKEHPLLGIGYNYLSHYEVTVDSSFLVSLVCFGVVPCLGGMIFLIAYLFRRVQKMRTLRNGLVREAYFTFVFYLGVIVFFSCHFNNIFYYQFWLIPMLTILTFLSLACDKKSRHPFMVPLRGSRASASKNKIPESL